jgi:hypothetical protein
MEGAPASPAADERTDGQSDDSAGEPADRNGLTAHGAPPGVHGGGGVAAILPEAAADEAAAGHTATGAEARRAARSRATEADPITDKIRALALQRKLARKTAKGITKEIRLKVRQRSRTHRNAKKLSDAELIQIVVERGVAGQVAVRAARMPGAAASSSAGPPPA